MTNPYEPGNEQPNPMPGSSNATSYAIRGAAAGAFVGFVFGSVGLAALIYFSIRGTGFFELLVLLVGVFLLLVVPAAATGAMIGIAINSFKSSRAR